MQFDRRLFIQSIGGFAGLSLLSGNALADKMDDFMMENALEKTDACAKFYQSKHPTVRHGVGKLFYNQDKKVLVSLTAPVSLVDLIQNRFSSKTVAHCLRSAHYAKNSGQDDLHVFIALIHDLAIDIISADHAWWGADLFAPYVDPRVSFAIRYHQACRFFNDSDYGYQVPEFYYCLFGKDLKLEPYMLEAYEYCKKHQWYEYARMVTVNDLYGFDPKSTPSLSEFIPLINKYFNQPKVGLGSDNSASAHMWRTVINPDKVL